MKKENAHIILGYIYHILQYRYVYKQPPPIYSMEDNNDEGEHEGLEEIRKHEECMEDGND